MDLSVIILSYNTKQLLRNCLKTVFNSRTGYKFEVLVPDNGSIDGSVEMVKQEFSANASASADKPQLKLIENNANLGFSKGNNIGIKQASGKYILLLNSDTEVNTETFDLSIKYMDAHPDVGAMGCKVLLQNGELDKAARRKFPNPVNAFLHLFGMSKLSDYNITTPIDQEVEVDAVVGAYMMVPKFVIDKVGLLDEEYFMYGEDLDWCWRIKEAGFKIMYYPTPSILHLKSASSKKIAFKVIRWAHAAMKIFYRKHYSQKHNWLFNQFIYLGINLRMFLVLFMNLIKKKTTIH